MNFRAEAGLASDVFGLQNGINLKEVAVSGLSSALTFELGGKVGIGKELTEKGMDQIAKTDVTAAAIAGINAKIDQGFGINKANPALSPRNP